MAINVSILPLSIRLTGYSEVLVDAMTYYNNAFEKTEVNVTFSERVKDSENELSDDIVIVKDGICVILIYVDKFKNDHGHPLMLSPFAFKRKLNSALKKAYILLGDTIT